MSTYDLIDKLGVDGKLTLEVRNILKDGYEAELSGPGDERSLSSSFKTVDEARVWLREEALKHSENPYTRAHIIKNRQAVVLSIEEEVEI